MSEDILLNRPKFSFLTIVFNGDDFLYESLMSVYEFAHEIFVVEGAERDAWMLANFDGSSTDRTNIILEDFPDIDNKIRIFHGRWRTKEEMTNVPVEYISGDYVWRLDSDEIYKKEDLAKLAEILTLNPEIEHVSLIGKEFYHGFEYIQVKPDGGFGYETNRIWKWSTGSYFKGHRPPDLWNPNKRKFMGKGPTITGSTLEKLYQINYYHYSLVTEKQAREKTVYYRNVYLRRFAVGIPLWKFVRFIPIISELYRRVFSRPWMDNYRIRNAFPEMNFRYYETVWLRWNTEKVSVEKEYGVAFNSQEPYVTVPFDGTHPVEIEDMIRSIAANIES